MPLIVLLFWLSTHWAIYRRLLIALAAVLLQQWALTQLCNHSTAGLFDSPSVRMT